MDQATILVLICIITIIWIAISAEGEEERKSNGKNIYRNVKKVEVGPSYHEKKEKNKKVN